MYSDSLKLKQIIVKLNVFRNVCVCGGGGGGWGGGSNLILGDMLKCVIHTFGEHPGAFWDFCLPSQRPRRVEPLEPEPIRDHSHQPALHKRCMIF